MPGKSLRKFARGETQSWWGAKWDARKPCFRWERHAEDVLEHLTQGGQVNRKTGLLIRRRRKKKKARERGRVSDRELEKGGKEVSGGRGRKKIDAAPSVAARAFGKKGGVSLLEQGMTTNWRGS